MNKPVNIGIIGVGRFGKNYFSTFNQLDNALVTWICATEESDIKATLKKANKDIKTTANYKDILDDKEVDAIAIVTPGSTHYPITKEALESDKHVIVEKPLAFNSKDAEKLVKISKEKKKILMVGHLHLFNPAIRKLKSDIKTGLFGKINYMHSFGAGNGPVRQDMNALWDYFPHDISILMYLLDQLPLSLSVNGASYLKKGVEDIATMDLEFPNGVFAIAIGTWLYPLKKRELIIVSEKLYAFFDDYSENEKLKYYDNRPKIVDGNVIIDNKKYQDIKIDDIKPLTEQLKHFLDCIENGKEPLTGGDHALKVIKVLESAQKSLGKKGARVEVPQ